MSKRLSQKAGPIDVGSVMQPRSPHSSPSSHQILGPMLLPLQQRRVQMSANPKLHLTPIYLTSRNWHLGSFCHDQSPPGTTARPHAPFPISSSHRTPTRRARCCVRHEKHGRASPLGRGNSPIPTILDTTSPVAASSNSASHKSKNIVIFSLNVKMFAIFHNCSHLGLQFHLNSILLPRM